MNKISLFMAIAFPIVVVISFFIIIVSIYGEEAKIEYSDDIDLDFKYENEKFIVELVDVGLTLECNSNQFDRLKRLSNGKLGGNSSISKRYYLIYKPKYFDSSQGRLIDIEEFTTLYD